MATITNYIKWASNTSDLKAQIAAGSSSIIAMKEAVDKTTASLGGQGLFRAANQTTAAVMQLGGASKLTGTEQAKINTQLEKAIEKYRLMGKEPPAAMVALAQATKQVETQTATAQTKTEGWSSQLKGLGAMIGITFSVGAVVAFGRELLAMGDSIVKVADQTGMTTSEVQKLSYIAAQSGNSIEELTSATSKLQVELGKGDKGTVAAVKALGLNFNELRAASPYQQLELISTAAQKIEEPTKRAALMTELFGKAGVANLPTLLSKFKELGDAAPVMSDNTVRGLDAAGDALDRFKLQIKIWAAESYNWTREGFQKIIEWVHRGIAALTDFAASTAELIAKLPGGGKVLAALGVDISQLRQEAQWYRDAAASMARETENVQKQAVVLSPTLADTAKAAKEQSDAMKVAAEKTKEAEAAILKFIAAGTGAAPVVNLLDTRIQALFQAETHLSRGLDVLPGQLKTLNGELLGVEDSAVRAGVAVGAFGTLIGRQLGVEVNHSTFSLNSWLATLQKLPAETLSVMAKVKGAFQSGFGSMLQGIPNLITAAFTGGGGFLGALKGLASQIGSTIGGSIGAMFGPLGSQIGSALGSLVGPLIAKLKSFFGGISPEIKKARDSVKAFEEQLASLLTQTQLTEAAMSGWGDTGAKTVIAVRDAYLAMGRTAEEADAIVKQLWDTDHPDRAKAAMEEINRVMEQYQQKLKAANVEQEKQIALFAQLPQDLAAMIQGATQFAGLLPPAFHEMIRLAEQAGGEFRQMAQDFHISMGEAMADNLARLVDQFELLSAKGIKPTRDQLQMLMTSAVAAFQTMIQNGADFLTVITQLAPTVKDIQALLTAAGLEGSDAFKEILRWANLVNDKIKGPLIQAAQLLNQQMELLANNGQMNQRRFNVMQRSVKDLFDQMINSGMSQRQALIAMQPNLQTIWELYKDHGMELDANTLRLIRMAEKQGLIGDKFRSTEDVMTRGILRIIQLLEAWLTAMGIELPKAITLVDDKFGTATSHMGKGLGIVITQIDTLAAAVAAIPDPKLTVTVDDREWRRWLRGLGVGVGTIHSSPASPVASFQAGSQGVRDFGAGTPAILHGREAVVTEREIREGGPVTGSPNLDAAVARLERMMDRRLRTQQRSMEKAFFLAARDGALQQRRGRR